MGKTVEVGEGGGGRNLAVFNHLKMEEGGGGSNSDCEFFFSSYCEKAMYLFHVAVPPEKEFVFHRGKNRRAQPPMV